jgi:hypothetical protein
MWSGSSSLRKLTSVAIPELPVLRPEDTARIAADLIAGNTQALRTLEQQGACDPIEFLHPHKKATVRQRELHSDTPTLALALRTALRQAPKVILVGEMHDRETIEIALTARVHPRSPCRRRCTQSSLNSRASGRLRWGLSGRRQGRRGFHDLALCLQPVLEIVAVLPAAGEEQFERPQGDRFGEGVSTRVRISATS